MQHLKASADPNDICCEIFNPGKELITFISVHPNRELHWFFDRPPMHWFRIECKPGEWCFLPHQHYTGSVPSGNQEIKVIKNFGNEMFKGNKYPSAPEVRRRLF